MITDEELKNLAITANRLHHFPKRSAGKPGVVDQGHSVNDEGIVRRIIAFFRKAINTPIDDRDAFWLHQFKELNKVNYEILDRGDVTEVAQMLRDPGKSTLFYGFDMITNLTRIDTDLKREGMKDTIYDCLLQLTEAVGTRRLENPETNELGTETPDVESILINLDTAMGFTIDFPNIYPGEAGLYTSRGIAGYRAIQALYQAWRIKQLLINTPDPSVVEIGAGLGRTAYYCGKMGIKSYTIVDIPFTSVSQAHFLSQSLGDDNVWLWGEQFDKQTIRIAPPLAFHEMDEKFDLVVNVDSLTEVGKDAAINYFQTISKKTPLFLSINHEHNAFTVSELIKMFSHKSVARHPYWLRRGYVEELIEFE